jgi:receptor protein-tyrosine kinase
MFDRATGERQGSQFLAALRRRWWVVVLCAIVAAGGAYVFTNRKQKLYSATSALLFVSSHLDQLVVGKQIIQTVDPTREAATNLSLVGLPSVGRAAAAELHIPTGRVIGEISFGSTPESDVLRITVTDPNPIMAARIANAYAQQYIVVRQTAERAQLAAAEALVQTKLAAIPPSQQGGPIYQTLVQDRNELDLLASTQTGDAQQVQSAGVPGAPSYPAPKKSALVGLFIGLLAAAVIILVLERLDRRIKHVAEIDDLYGVPVLGSIPTSGALAREGALGTPRDQDAFSMVRARLRYFDVDRDVKRVMVTSAQKGDGKSLVSLNLARAAARADDRRVLLIEADMRLPSLAQVLGMDAAVGLGELLSQSHDLVSGLHELVFSLNLAAETDTNQDARLDVLLSGAVPPNPEQLLSSERMAALLDYVETIYDLVIIDTPSVEEVSDAIPLVHQVDGVVVVSRVGHTRRDRAADLMKQLRGLNANVLGVVINAVEVNVRSYYGYSQGDRSHPDGGRSVAGSARGGRA